VFKTARAMLANRFLPDTISSDVHALCINGPAFRPGHHRVGRRRDRRPLVASAASERIQDALIPEGAGELNFRRVLERFGYLAPNAPPTEHG
jgi:hypothetical protein